MIQKIFARNIVVFLVLGAALAFSIDWKLCFNQRARYLLGIYYNGNFEHKADGQVYNDYLKRHGTTHYQFKNSL